MTYATLMVHLDQEHANEARIEIAGELAEKFDARVIGVAACELSQSVYFAEGAQAAKLIEEGREALRQRMAEMERHFRQALRTRAREVEWRSGVEFPTNYVAQQSRAADLVITGSKRSIGIADPLQQLDVGDLLMQVGRPMLVVPPQAHWLDTRTIMIAWKDTREARKAVWDALPLLHKAGEVRVVEIVEEDEDRSLALGRVRDVAGWLSHHGIEASTLVPNARGDATDQLELMATDLGASVVVAGAYGHTRLREWAFGGVTRNLIMHAKRCSLLSH